MDQEIPDEFRPKRKEKTEEDNEGLEFSELFGETDQLDGEDDQNSPLDVVTIGSRSFRLKLPPDIGTLFAHRIWSGSMLLARFLDSNSEKFVRNKRTIEFGAGSALPSLVCLSNGSSFSAITDYPDEDLLDSIRETVGWNWEICQRPKNRVSVIGHLWGTRTDEITKTIFGHFEHDEESSEFFDVALLSECLWLHRCHQGLAASLDAMLHPKVGVAIVTYAHHVPGMEKEDNGFFEICELQYGFKIERVFSEDLEYMWDKEKTTTVYLVMMRRS